MRTITILQGVPGSGKSTYFKEQMKSKNVVCVNRDSIRKMFGDYWVPDREKLVEESEYKMVEGILGNSDYDIVVDDTNLNSKTIEKWKNVAEKHNTKIVFKEFKISIYEAIKRDSLREDHKVGKKVILGFYKKYYPEEYKDYFTDERLKSSIPVIDESKQSVVLCDLDGTLALHRGRDPFDYSKIPSDELNIQLTNFLDKIEPEIIFISSREGTAVARENTIKWLEKHGYGSNKLFMRNAKDYRPDDIVKLEIYNKFIRPNYNVLAIFDDRDKVVNMWRNQSLLCLQVYKGDF